MQDWTMCTLNFCAFISWFVLFDCIMFGCIYSSTCLGRPPSWVATCCVRTLCQYIPTYFKVKLPVISGHLPKRGRGQSFIGCQHLHIYWLSANATFSVVISTKNRWRAPKLATDRSLKFPCCRLVIMTMRVFIRNIAGGDNIMYYCMVYYIWRPRLPVRPCDERPPATYGHFCLVPRVSVHDRYYCTCIVACFFAY